MCDRLISPRRASELVWASMPQVAYSPDLVYKESMSPNTSHTPRPNQPSHPVADNVSAIAAIEAEDLENRTLEHRSAQAFTRRIGSTGSVAIHAVAFSIWVTINLGLVPMISPFDPYPFPFLACLLSIEVIFLSLFVLINQRYSESRAERRSHLNLQIDMLTEQESTEALLLLRQIADHMKIPARVSETEAKLAQPTDLQKVHTTLEQNLQSE